MIRHLQYIKVFDVSTANMRYQALPEMSTKGKNTIYENPHNFGMSAQVVRLGEVRLVKIDLFFNVAFDVTVKELLMKL